MKLHYFFSKFVRVFFLYYKWYTLPEYKSILVNTDELFRYFYCPQNCLAFETETSLEENSKSSSEDLDHLLELHGWFRW